MLDYVKDVLFYFFFISITGIGIAIIFLIVRSILIVYFEHIRELQARKYPFSEIYTVLSCLKRKVEERDLEVKRKSKTILDVLDYLIKENTIKAQASVAYVTAVNTIKTKIFRFLKKFCIRLWIYIRNIISFIKKIIQLILVNAPPVYDKIVLYLKSSKVYNVLKSKIKEVLNGKKIS